MNRDEPAPAALHRPSPPSEWVRRFVDFIPADGVVLDVACGDGRHTRLLLEHGRRVIAVDRDTSGVADLVGRDDVRVVAADLEAGGVIPLLAGPYAAVIVTNYLHRPLLPDLPTSLAIGGLLVYETFAAGNERFGRPRSPAHLLEHGELLEAVRGRLRVLAYEEVIVDSPRLAAIQRICARRVSGVR